MNTNERTPAPWRGDERSTLTGYLSYHRQTLLMKCQGLSDEQLRLRPTVSALTLPGLVKHLAYVERQWFQYVMAGRKVYIPWREGDTDGDFRIEPDETVDGILNFYQSECTISDEIAAAYDLDDLALWTSSEDERRSLRWILVHMIEETARHVGHADILRESIDGVKGE